MRVAGRLVFEPAAPVALSIEMAQLFAAAKPLVLRIRVCRRCLQDDLRGRSVAAGAVDPYRLDDLSVLHQSAIGP